MSDSPPPPPPPSGDPGQPQQPPYGTPQYPQAYGAPPPDHPQSSTVLILGILGLVVCGVAAPFAWVMGNRVVREIDASGGAQGGRSQANAGRILGIIGSCFLGLALLFVIGVIVIAFAGVATS